VLVVQRVADARRDLDESVEKDHQQERLIPAGGRLLRHANAEEVATSE
jgi:hypothetical protein